jgi:hypothetical protein
MLVIQYFSKICKKKAKKLIKKQFYKLAKNLPKIPCAKNPFEPSEIGNKNPHQKLPIMLDKNLLRQKLAELIIELTDADLGEVSNIYEAIDTIIAEVSE